jgi:hypothetical protein
LAGALVVLALLSMGLRMLQMGRISKSQPQAVPPQAAIRASVPTPPASLPATATLKALRYSSKAAFTAVEIELDRPVVVRTNALHHPERVYFDLSDTSMSATLNPPGAGTFRLPLGAGLVQRIRMAQKRESSTRVVLDLSQPCRYAFIMSPSPPYRLVIDVEPQHPADVRH